MANLNEKISVQVQYANVYTSDKLCFKNIHISIKLLTSNLTTNVVNFKQHMLYADI